MKPVVLVIEIPQEDPEWFSCGDVEVIEASRYYASKYPNFNDDDEADAARNTAGGYLTQADELEASHGEQARQVIEALRGLAEDIYERLGEPFPEPGVCRVLVKNWYPAWPSNAGVEALEAAGYTVCGHDGFEASIEADVSHDGTQENFADQAFELTGIGNVLEAAGVSDFDTEFAIYTVTDLSGRFDEEEWGC